MMTSEDTHRPAPRGSAPTRTWQRLHLAWPSRLSRRSASERFFEQTELALRGVPRTPAVPLAPDERTRAS